LAADEQLDIQVDPKHGAEYLKKYDLNSNDAILAEEKHMAM
jgi:adenosine kinase